MKRKVEPEREALLDTITQEFAATDYNSSLLNNTLDHFDATSARDMKLLRKTFNDLLQSISDLKMKETVNLQNLIDFEASEAVLAMKIKALQNPLEDSAAKVKIVKKAMQYVNEEVLASSQLKKNLEEETTAVKENKDTGKGETPKSCLDIIEGALLSTPSSSTSSASASSSSSESCILTLLNNFISSNVDELKGGVNPNPNNLTEETMNAADSENQDIRRWLVLSAFLANRFPWWKSKFSWLIQEAVMDARKGISASKILDPILQGSYTTPHHKVMQENFDENDLKKDPTFDLRRFVVGFGYDNIQHVKYAKRTETGAGVKDNTVIVRTMRIVLKFESTEWAKMQFMYEFNPVATNKKYPLANVPIDCMRILDNSDDNNEEGLSELDYLTNEFEYGILTAIHSIKEKGDEWQTELRGESFITQEKADHSNLKDYQKICSFCNGPPNRNRHGRCTSCGSVLPIMAEVRAKSSAEATVTSIKSEKQQTRSKETIDEEKYRPFEFFKVPETISYNQIAIMEADEEQEEKKKDPEDKSVNIQRVPLAIVDLNPSSHALKVCMNWHTLNICSKLPHLQLSD